jgi:dihydrofolate synthase/folylpolyglutamate synthase
LTYSEAITFLFDSLPVWERAGAGAYKPGLERISAFISKMGLDGVYSPTDRHPFALPVGMRPVKTVHVAGTNGKGSVSHMLAAVLQSSGYRTGLFTSPHLVDFRERIRVNGKMIPEQAVVEFTEEYRDEMVRVGLTFFEMATAMGLWWFARGGCDVAIIEAGLGGRLDSTNIITPVLSVITNIGLEHTQYLGNTIAAIATEKAGIIKPGIPVVIGEADPESEPVFRRRAAELGSPIVFADKSNYELRNREAPEPGSRIPNYESDLTGDYQQKNIRTVLAAADVLWRQSFDIYDAALREGFAHAAALTGLRGRWEALGTAPLVVCDTAHNAHGLAEVSKQLARQPYDKLYMVLGFAGDKDLDAIIPLLPPNAHYILTQAAGPRAMRAEELLHRFSSQGISSETVVQVAAAVEKALSLASPRDMVYIGGSNFVVGEALPLFEC